MGARCAWQAFRPLTQQDWEIWSHLGMEPQSVCKVLGFGFPANIWRVESGYTQNPEVPGSCCGRICWQVIEVRVYSGFFFFFITLWPSVQLKFRFQTRKENYKERASSHGVVYHVPVSAGYKGCHPLFQGTCGNRAWLSVNPTRVGIWCLLSEKGNLWSIPPAASKYLYIQQNISLKVTTRSRLVF